MIMDDVGTRQIPILKHLAPPKVAYMIRSGDESLRNMAMALRVAGATWGGGGHVIVPMRDQGKLHPTLERLLRWYNPDFIGALVPTGQDLEDSAPGTVDTRLAQQGASNEIARQVMLAQSFPDVELDEWCNTLSHELPVFKFENHPYATSFAVRPDEGFPSILTSIDHALSPNLLDDRIVVKDQRDLSLALRFGVREIDVSDRGEVGLLTREQFNSLIEENIATVFNPRFHNLVDVMTQQTTDTPVLYVAGLTAEDAALALLWDRCVGPAILLPAGSGEDLARQLSLIPFIPRTIAVTSLSLSAKEIIHKLPRDLILQSAPRGLTDAAYRYLSPDELPLKQKRFLVSENQWDQRDSIYTERDHSGAVMQAALRNVRPTMFTAKSWTTLVSVEGHTVTTHRTLANGLLLERDRAVLGEALTRPDMGGIRYWSQPMGLVSAGSSEDFQIAAPRLRLPSASALVSQAAQDVSRQIELSSAGVRTEYVLSRFGSRSQLAKALIGKKKSLLFAFAELAQSGEEPRDGKRFRKGDRVALRWDYVSDWLSGREEDHAEARAQVDEFVRTGVLQRGFLLKCSRCAHVFFYALRAVGNQFSCERCAWNNDMVQAAWKEPADGDEPMHWFSLDRVVLAWLVQNGHLPLLATHLCLMTSSMSQGLVLPEFELRFQGSSEVEFDFCIATDNELVVGEAKLNDRLADSSRGRRRELHKLYAGAVRLRSNRVIFATAQNNWHEGFVAEVREIQSHYEKNQGWRVEVSTIVDVAGVGGEGPSWGLIGLPARSPT